MHGAHGEVSLPGSKETLTDIQISLCRSRTAATAQHQMCRNVWRQLHVANDDAACLSHSVWCCPAGRQHDAFKN